MGDGAGGCWVRLAEFSVGSTAAQILERSYSSPAL